jgi:ketopantoate reductase
MLGDLLNKVNGTMHYHENTHVERWKRLLVNGGENPGFALDPVCSPQFFDIAPDAP